MKLSQAKLAFLPMIFFASASQSNPALKPVTILEDSFVNSAFPQSADFQTELSRQEKNFNVVFRKRVAAGDRKSGLYECFSRNGRDGTLVTYDPKDISPLRRINFTPTNWNLRPIIVIDPGHGHGTTNSSNGPIDIGAAREGVREVDVIDNVTKALIDEFERRDIAFVTTRRPLDDGITLTRKSVFPEHPAALQVRAELSNHIARTYPNHPVIFMSLHADVSTNTAMSGTVIFSYAEEFGRKPLSPLSTELARSLSTKFSIRPGTSTRRQTDDFAVLRCQPENVSAVLVELGFLSNAHDRRVLSDPGHARDIARNLASGIENFVEKQRGGEIRVALNAAP